MQKGHVVAELFQVADDVGGDEHGVVLVPGEVREDLHHLVPHHRVQPGGGLIQHQEPGVVGQGHGDGQLHFHAPGELLEALVPRQGQPSQIVLVDRLIPAAEDPGHDPAHLPGRQALGIAGLIQHHADLVLVRALPAQHPDAAPVRPGHAQEHADGGALPGAVFAHQAQDTALGQRQVDLQVKVPIVLFQRVQFNGVHVPSSSRVSSISRSSRLPRPESLASSSAALRCSSICRRCSSRSSSSFLAATKLPLPGRV